MMMDTYFTQGGGFLIPKESKLKGEGIERRKKEEEEEERRNIYHLPFIYIAYFESSL
jgi:hypothetical protein